MQEPVDGTWLAALRILLGVVLGVSMLRFLAYGWIDRFFVQPHFHFKYWGFEWVEPLPGPYMHALFWLLAALSFASALGLFYRFSAIAFALGLTYVQLIDVTTYLNHYYLAALLAWLLAFSPAARCWSLDAWRRGPAADGGSQVAAGALYLFRIQVGMVYIFAGLAKLQSDWLLHAQPLRIWLGARADLPLIGPTFSWPWVPLAMSWAGFLFDTTIVGWLAWRRSRPYAYAILLAFHALTRLLFPIGMFPLIMSCAALVFFNPDWPRKLLRLSKPCPSPCPCPAVSPLAIALGTTYCAIQLLVPLRSFAYDGNVLWHEQGMRFSFRVMLRAKGGHTTFVVHDRASGRTFHVSPREYLTDLQESEMSGQPDMILQLAKHIRRDFEARGLGPVEVRADARAALNGRLSTALVDPTVDLSLLADGFLQAPWITQAPSAPPPHTRPVR